MMQQLALQERVACRIDVHIVCQPCFNGHRPWFTKLIKH